MNKIFSVIFLLTTSLIINACSPFSDDTFFEPEKTDAYNLQKYRIDTGYEIKRVSLDSNDGNSTIRIYGVYIGDIEKINVNKVIVYAHDKYKNIDHYWPRIEALAEIGLDDFGIFIIDYRGYGESEGTPSEQGVYADINTALAWLEDQGLTGDRLTLYGYGLGAAIVIELSANPRSLVPEKLIIEAPFASIKSLIQDTTLQSTPSSYVSNLKFNNVEKMKNISQPILWLHGTEDKVYNIKSQGQLVYDAHPDPEMTSFVKVEGASHFNIPDKFDGGIETYANHILTFISVE